MGGGGDAELVQIVDAALADAVRRSGDWLVCRAGCSQCCYGVFEISGLDAERLRGGLRELEMADPERAGRVRARVAEAREKLGTWFPGDLVTGVLTGTEEEVELFEEFAHAEACPLLDPATQGCDLYGARPILCRTFGPPIRNEEGEAGELAICELNFVGGRGGVVGVGGLSSGLGGGQGGVGGGFGGGGTMVAFAFGVEAGGGKAVGFADTHSSRETTAR